MTGTTAQAKDQYVMPNRCGRAVSGEACASDNFCASKHVHGKAGDKTGKEYIMDKSVKVDMVEDTKQQHENKENHKGTRELRGNDRMRRAKRQGRRQLYIE